MKTWWMSFPAIVVVVFFSVAAGRVERGPDPIALAESIPSLADPDDCLACHDDNGLTMKKNGRVVSLFVSPESYGASPHRRLDCLECHVGFDPDEEPHLDEIPPVDCASCHATPVRDLRHGGHGGDLACASCHGDSHTPAVSAKKNLCLDCHEDAARDIQASAHASAENGPGCLDCHGAHTAKKADTSLCLTCHGDEAFAAANLPGQDAHLIAAFQESIHADVIECSDCHGGHLIPAAGSVDSRVSRQNLAQTCDDCHDDVADVYRSSEHGRALAEGMAGAPSCVDCHGEHDIHSITDQESHMSREHEVAVCQSCHLDSPEVRDRMTHSSAFISSYSQSVHGRAAAAGNLEAAICSDCHGGHQAMKASDPASKINQMHIAETCGTCHDETEVAFAASTHGQALAKGVADAPTCTTCHGEHSILESSLKDSPVAGINVSEQVCSPCHNSYKLSEKYDFPSDRTASFSDSYHGLATRFGSASSANCASCHGVHDILPSRNPESRVHPANLAETCGSCHPGANMNFAKGSVHVIRSPEGDAMLYWISSIYIVLIIAIVGFMFLHNLLDWFRKLILKHRERVSPDPYHPPRNGGRLYLRMTVNERIQHALLASSFLLLVLTGFILKYPEAGWVLLLRSIGGDFFFDLRGLLHRGAAVVMIAASFYHLYYVIFSERGRGFIKDIMVSRQDLKDMVQMIRFNVGLTKARPLFGRFNYIEKSEYWALIWGTVIMAGTGIALWFENQFMGWFSKLFIDVSGTIHYYEAWLAFLAIVVWHFYYVIFNPDVYPLNLTWLTGTLTEEEMEHEHPLELSEKPSVEEGV